MRPLLICEGLCQQVRLDHGTEFALVITAEQHLAGYRLWQDRHSILQSTARQNHQIEHLWPEVNQRINYPVKTILAEIDMINDTVKFCVSWTVIIMLYIVLF
jgi:hypothetical protein